MKKRKILTYLSALFVGICLLFTLSACKNNDEPADSTDSSYNSIDSTESTDGICNHAWEDVSVLKEATCTEAGSVNQKCTECDETRTVEISALGHSFEAWTTDTDKHWQECEHNGCSVKQNEGSHSYTDGKCSCGKCDTSCTEGLTILYNAEADGKMSADIYYVSGYNGSSASVKLPYYYDDGEHGVKPLGAIGENAFAKNTVMTEITVPDTVTYIHYTAFNGSAWYKAQADGIVYVGKVAFIYKGEMPNNHSVVLKEDTVAIAEYAFNSQLHIKSVAIPDSVTVINRYAFNNCTSLETVSIGKNVSFIGAEAFSNCQALTEVTVPDSVKILRNNVFKNCINLKSVTFGSGITQICENIFNTTPQLTSITFGCTKAELEAVVKDVVWYSGCSENLVITCKDGRFN